MSSEKKSEFQNENNKIKARASSENKNRDYLDLKKEKNGHKIDAINKCYIPKATQRINTAAVKHTV